MNFLTQRRDLFLALLVAVWAHVGIFFIFVMLLNFGLLAATVMDEEEPEEEPRPIQMQVVYAEPEIAPIRDAPPLEPIIPAPMPEPVFPDEEAFVQTNESQAVEKAPEETPFIGERNTTATSDAGAVAGEEKMAALAGEEERKSDPKTFDADFSNGDTSGPSEGMKETLEAGEGEEKVNEEALAASKTQAEPVEEAKPEVEEEIPRPKEDELASIDQTLAALEEAMAEEKKDPQKNPAEVVEESLPEKPAEKEQQASKQDGGFAPRTRKTRVAGVLSADGKGSLNVADTPAGRYQADILKKLETAWQMDNYRNRSLNNPGQVTLYFVVDQKGRVSRQKQISMVGASDNQFGRILGAVESLKIPKMSKEVIKDLDGEALELMVTFNY